MSFLLRATAGVAARLPRLICPATTTPLPSSLLSALPNSPLPWICARHRGSMTFFAHLSQERLWKSATSVSNAGRKRGRARGRKMVKNLNRGQVLGFGNTNMVWPGLNAPLFRGKEPVQQQQLPPDPSRKEKLYKMRDSIEKFRQVKVTPLERGWSGNKMPGRSLGPPDPIGDEKFDEFDTKVLEMKQVANMTGTVGRVRRFSILVVTGNKKGLMSVALAKAIDARTALRKARNRSIKKLRFVERFEGRTVFHDFHHQIDSTHVFVERKPEGYGIVGHRAIKTICEQIGIRDLHAKVEGRINLQKVVKCFIAGLEAQETHEQLSERKGLHVVEFQQEHQAFPHVLASPKTQPVRTEVDRVGDREELRFPQLYMDGRVRLRKPKNPPFYTKLPSWEKKLKEMEITRNHRQILEYHWLQRELKGPLPLYQHLREPDKGHLPFSKPTKPEMKPKK
ncbi:28S ribosomal protein S5, mitochondrial [Hypsibius exemplaris]|uniref:Small ribosomal subunit protein uS5m n=1 Tax=Hypsibius exemplaris TaxID=2072580 RepID=A0A1W0WV85_HYPEX|nr:28S ribosomal protein S5, mitochondrial [Hypsibius exemplaris]